MGRENAIKENITLKDKIASLPDGSILFRSDYPEYHSEFVGSTLAELTDDGILSKIAQGIYVKPTKSRFGLVFPSVEKVVQAIATRDNAQIFTFRNDSSKCFRTIYSNTNELFVFNFRK